MELYAALKRRSSTVARAGVNDDQGWKRRNQGFNVKIKVKVKVKGVGQECPTHTCYVG